MPNINLRLTEEEHAALERWAKDGHRSLQKEIIFRLFSEPTATAKMPPLPRSGIGEPTQADAQPRDIPARSVTTDQDWLLRRAGKKK